MLRKCHKLSIVVSLTSFAPMLHTVNHKFANAEYARNFSATKSTKYLVKNCIPCSHYQTKFTSWRAEKIPIIHGLGGLNTRLFPEGPPSRIFATNGVTAISRPVSYPCRTFFILQKATLWKYVTWGFKYHRNPLVLNKGKYHRNDFFGGGDSCLEKKLLEI